MKPIGLAIGLWAVGSGEAVLEAEIGASLAYGVDAVARAIVVVNPLGLATVLLEEGKDAPGGFIGEDLGASQAAVTVDGDVQVFLAGTAGVIALAVAGDAMAGAHVAGQLLDVEMNEFTGLGALIAADHERRLERSEADDVAVEEARDRSLGDPGRASDLEAWQLAAAQRQNSGAPERVDGSGGTLRARTAILKSCETFGPEASQPFVGTAFGNAETRRNLCDRLV